MIKQAMFAVAFVVMCLAVTFSRPLKSPPVIVPVGLAGCQVDTFLEYRGLHETVDAEIERAMADDVLTNKEYAGVCDSLLALGLAE